MEKVSSALEREIILQLQEGDEKAFRYLYEKYAPGLKSFCVRFGFSAYESDDVIQESFRKIWEGRDKVDPELHFNTYLITLAKHLVYNQLRRQLQEKKYQAGLGNQVHKNSLKPDYTLHKLIEETIEELPVKCRDIYRKSREEGYTNAEIAQRMSISKSTVENHINKALRKLRGALRHSGYANFLKIMLLVFMI